MARSLIASLFTAVLVAVATPVAAQEHTTPLPQTESVISSPPVAGAWMTDRPVPKSIKALYGSYAVLQGLDMYSTSVALRAGAREANPLMQTSMGHAIGLKAVMGLTTYYAVNKMSKKNRKGAMVTMVILNGVTAAVVANNLKNSRR